MLYHFKNTEAKPDWGSLIDEHAAFINRNIYLTPYKGGAKRLYHGGPHAAGAALGVVILANLYHHFKDSEEQALTKRQLFLLQIAALLHDSAREDDGVDRWDCESGENCYYYLTEVLRLEHDEACIYAEAIANKDADTTNKFYKLTLSHDNKIIWNEKEGQKKDFFDNLIHDTDCLEYLRIQPTSYDGRYLDFYKMVAIKNYDALQTMGVLIAQYRSLLTILGYNSSISHSQKKAFYETEPEIYLKIKELILMSPNLGLLKQLYHEGELVKIKILNQDQIENKTYNDVVKKTNNKQSIWDNQELNKRFHNFEIFFRGISYPSKKNDKFNISNAGTELKFIFSEEGNPDRSITRLGYGIFPIIPYGYVIFNKENMSIQEAYELDGGTGNDKKKRYQKRKFSTSYGAITQEVLENIRFNSLLGGVKTNHQSFLKNVNEVVSTIYNYDAVMFCVEATKKHPYKVTLNAIYLQQIFKKMKNKTLDIIEYSAAHSQLRIRQYSENDILNMWYVLSENYIKEQIKKNNYALLYDSPVMILAAIHDSKPGKIFITIYYSEELKNKLNNMIIEIQKLFIAQYQDNLFVNIEQKSEVILTDRAQQAILQKTTFSEIEKKTIKIALNTLSKRIKFPESRFCNVLEINISDQIKKLPGNFQNNKNYKLNIDDKKILAKAHPYLYLLYLSDVFNCKKLRFCVLNYINKIDSNDRDYFKHIFLYFYNVYLGNKRLANKYQKQAMGDSLISYANSTEPWKHILNALNYFISLSIKVSEESKRIIINHIKNSDLKIYCSIVDVIDILNLLDVEDNEKEKIIQTIIEKEEKKEPNFMEFNILNKIIHANHLSESLFKNFISHINVAIESYSYYVEDIKSINEYLLRNGKHVLLASFVEKIDCIDENICFYELKKLFKNFVSNNVLNLFPKFKVSFERVVEENSKLTQEKKQKYLFWCSENIANQQQDDINAISNQNEKRNLGQ